MTTESATAASSLRQRGSNHVGMRQYNERVVLENDHAVAICPWWSGGPYEMLIIPRNHDQHLTDSSDSQVAGVGRALDAIERFTFDEPTLAALDGVVDGPTLEWLASYRFSGDIWGYAEGEAYFPYSPLLVVEGTFAEAVILETLVLSVLNHDCAIASAAMYVHTSSSVQLDSGNTRML